MCGIAMDNQPRCLASFQYFSSSEDLDRQTNNDFGNKG